VFILINQFSVDTLRRRKKMLKVILFIQLSHLLIAKIGKISRYIVQYFSDCGDLKHLFCYNRVKSPNDYWNSLVYRTESNKSHDYEKITNLTPVAPYFIGHASVLYSVW